MSEQDYILVRDLSNVKHALAILADICPENSTIIDSKSLKQIKSHLYIWQEKHYEAIHKLRDEREKAKR